MTEIEQIKKLIDDNQLLYDFLLGVTNDILNSPLGDDMEILKERCPDIIKLLDLCSVDM